MKSLRLDPELEQRLVRAAAAAGETLSEFIRRAAAARAEAVLGGGGETDWSDVVGAVHGGGGQARRSGDAFSETLTEANRRA